MTPSQLQQRDREDMKACGIILLILTCIILSLLAAGQTQEKVKTEAQSRFGPVSRIERCVFNKGPFWWTHKNDSVFYVEFTDGSHVWVYQPLFGDSRWERD